MQFALVLCAATAVSVTALPLAEAGLGSGLGGALGGIGNGLGSGVSGIGQGAGSSVSGIGQGAGSGVSGIGQGAGAGVDGIGQGTGNGVSKRGIGSGAGAGVNGIGQGTGSGVSGIGQGAGSGVSGIGQGTGSGVSGVGQGTGSAVSGIGEGLGGALSRRSKRGLGSGLGGSVNGIGQGSGNGLLGLGLGAGNGVSATGQGAEDIFAATEELRTHLSSTPRCLTKESSVFQGLYGIVHGSNLIEGVGTSPVCTGSLWRSSFGRQDPEDLSQKHRVYRWLKLEQHRRNQSDDDATIQKIYREVVQHFRALMFLLDQVVLRDKPFSEELILQAHKTLTYKVDSVTDSYKVYGGVYRTTHVCAGLTTFTAPEHVPQEMRAFAAELSSDILAAEQVGHIDPYVLSAKYCHKFVNIHPFADGNGRMCRLILNILLFKYAGVFCVLGENKQAKDVYLSIAARAGESDRIWKEADEEETAFMKPPWGEFALLDLRQTKKDMQQILDSEALMKNPPDSCARNVPHGHKVSESSSSRTDE
ncbi:hypothetical protein KCU65_g1764, partial [Aureobasidium melanogenum]